MEFYIENALDKVKVIEENKKYWFIRTYAGEAFDIYREEKFVGLGLNNVPLELIKQAKPTDLNSIKPLRTFIHNNTEYKNGSATRWANQLLDFYYNASVGDTVIIPSPNSYRLAIGRITSDVYLVKDPQKIVHRGKQIELPEKRRTVEWQEVLFKDNLQGDLRGLLASQNGITSADEYSDIIEGLLDSLFIKDDQIHLVIKIDQNEEINAFDFNKLLDSITYFYKEFCIENGIVENEELTIKIRMQSKGRVALKALAYVGVIGLAGLIALSNNSSFNADISKGKLEGKSDGVFKSYSDFLDKKLERKMKWERFKDSLEAVKAKREKVNELRDDITDSTEQGRK